MAVIRTKKTKDFTTMSNYHLRDKELSLKAKGLLCIMLSLPKDWNFNIKGLSQLSADGIYAVRDAVRELERYGYLVRHQQRNEKGRIVDTEYQIYEHPHAEQAVSDEPPQKMQTSDQPQSGNSPPVNRTE